MPTLVDETRLGAANSLNALNNNLARLIGPALGGLLIASVGFGGGRRHRERTDIPFGCATCPGRACATNCTREQDRHCKGLFRRLASEWRTGLGAVRQNRTLLLSFSVAAITGLGEGTISTLMVPFIKVMLGGGGLELGLIMSAQAIGGIAGGLLLTNFADRYPDVESFSAGAHLLGGVMDGLLLNYPLFYPVLWPSLSALIASRWRCLLRCSALRR